MAKGENYLRPRQDKSRAASGVISSFDHSSAHLAVPSLRAGSHCQPPSGSHRWHASYAIIGAIAALIILVSLSWIFQLRIVPTDSAAPAGIYQLERIGGLAALTWDEAGLPTVTQAQRGELVMACLPLPIAVWAMQRHYIAGGSCPGGAEPVVKMLGAIQGDEVVVEGDFVAVNDVPFPHSQTAAADSQGRPLPHTAWGPRQVATGEVWLFGFNNPRSWDGRYFGAIPAMNILGILQPMVTW